MESPILKQHRKLHIVELVELLDHLAAYILVAGGNYGHSRIPRVFRDAYREAVYIKAPLTVKPRNAVEYAEVVGYN